MTLTSWFDASAMVQPDGTVLNSWPDLSSSNKPAVSTSPRAPLVKTNIQNGLRAVLFDGIDDWMNWHPADAPQISRLVAFEWLGPTTNGSGDPRIWEGYTCWLSVHTADNSLRIHYPRGTTSGDYRTPAGIIQPNTPYLIELYRDRNLVSVPPEIWVNGIKISVSVISVESGIVTGDTFDILGNATNNVNGPRAIKAHFFEVRFFNTILADTDKASNRSELLSKWAIAGAVKAKNTTANEASFGNIPEILLMKDTVRGKINYASTLTAVRTTVSPSKQQIISANIGFSGDISKKFVRRKLIAGLNLTGSASSQITNLTSTLLNANIGLSGRLVPTIIVEKKHYCKECIKRWAHRWFSRSD